MEPLELGWPRATAINIAQDICNLGYFAVVEQFANQATSYFVSVHAPNPPQGWILNLLNARAFFDSYKEHRLLTDGCVAEFKANLPENCIQSGKPVTITVCEIIEPQ